MTTFKIDALAVDGKNNGIAREWALCRYYGIKRNTHDRTAYDKGSDIEVAGMNISVKASGFSLMSGSLCEGRETFEGIFNLYAERVHSDHFAYITKDFTVYMMDFTEFAEFIHKFCGVEHESSKNGGKAKIKCRAESKRMLDWMAAKVAA